MRLDCVAQRNAHRGVGQQSGVGLRKLEFRLLARKWPQPVAAQPADFIFIPDTAKDPTALPRGDELWVLATIPRKGPPRLIELGVKKAGETEIRRLNLQ